MDAIKRFMVKVDKHGPIAKNDPRLGPCWVWTAAMQSNGYGAFKADGRVHLAHRWIWERCFGPIPDGRELDHFACDNPPCVNPLHARPVTHRANLLRGSGPSAIHARKTKCPRGHAFTPENTYVYRGKRDCRICKKTRRREYRERTGR